MTDNDEDIRRLLQAAGAREEPSAAMRARVHDVALKEWQSVVADSDQVTHSEASASADRSTDLSADLPTEQQGAANTPGTYRHLAMAASVAIAGFLGLMFFVNQAAAPALAQIKFSTGTYSVPTQTEERLSLVTGASLRTNAASHLMLEMALGSKVHLDELSQIVLRDSNTLELVQGRIYVDSSDKHSLSVITPEAIINDIGTLFEVGLDSRNDQRLTVALREGEVTIVTADETIKVQAKADRGELVEVDQSGAKRKSLSTLDKRWDWVQQARPPLQLQGISVYDYLAWVARDSGRTLKFANRSAEILARTERFASRVTSDRVSVAAALKTTSRFALVDDTPHTLMVTVLD